MKLGEFLQGAGAYLAYALFRALPPDTASALGGWIGRQLGPHLRPTAVARENLAASLPEINAAARERILRSLWDNVGRVAGEFPHVGRFCADPGRVEFVGVEHVRNLIEDGKPGILISAHLGNWELAPYASSFLGLPFALIYRAANNPHVEALYRKARGSTGGEMLPKGNAGARRALEILREGGHLGMLVDQKMNDGIAVPFFGRPAMTAPAVAQFAFKYELPVVQARVVRLKGARFRVEVLPPIFIEKTGDRHADLLAFMTRINQQLEAWIREYPAQWLWLHRRWPR